MIRKVVFRSAIAVIAVFALIGVVGWIGSERALHPAYYHYKHSLADYPDLHPEDIAVKSASGVVLRGRFFEGSNRDLIVLASGYGDTQDQMLPYAEFLRQAGFDTLTFNARARSDSGGEYVTLGVLEQIDLDSVVKYAAHRTDVDPEKIGVLGISMGGATAILTAARDRQIRAVVDDCGFSDAPSVIAASFEHFIHLPAIPFAPVTIWIASHRAGIDVNAVRPDEVIGQISPRPILIIHGLADYVVPVANSERNFKAAGEPKELWLVPGARHGEAHTVAKAEYEKKVVDFFENALK
ncbi:MAG: alpha/beta hydrolase [Bryobacteraceae bacterium]